MINTPLVQEVLLVCPFYIIDESDERMHPETHYQHKHCRVFREHGELCFVHKQGGVCTKLNRLELRRVEYHKRDLIEKDKEIQILGGHTK